MIPVAVCCSYSNCLLLKTKSYRNAITVLRMFVQQHLKTTEKSLREEGTNKSADLKTDVNTMSW